MGLFGFAGMFIIILIVVAICLIPEVFFILTLQKALQRCSPENRVMSPGSTWLLLIPVFNLIWMFIIVTQMAESLEREFRKRDIPVEPSPGKSIGLAWCILTLSLPRPAPRPAHRARGDRLLDHVLGEDRGIVFHTCFSSRGDLRGSCVSTIIVRNTPGVAGALLLCAFFASGCTSLALQSRWMDSGGGMDSNRWRDALMSLGERDASLSVQNDAGYVQVSFITTDPTLQERILHQGIFLWFDPDGGEAHRFGIRYPVAWGAMPISVDGEPHPAGDRPGSFGPGWGKPGDDIEVYTDGYKEYERLGKRDAGGIDAEIRKMSDTLLCQFRVPLRTGIGLSLCDSARHRGTCRRGYRDARQPHVRGIDQRHTPAPDMEADPPGGPLVISPFEPYLTGTAMIRPFITLSPPSLSSSPALVVAGVDRVSAGEKPGSLPDLNGTWLMKDFSPGAGMTQEVNLPGKAPKDALPIQIPGTVRTALLAAGRIPDPYDGYDNEKSLWVEQKEWWFFKTFPLDAALKGKWIDIVFEGTSFQGEVWINGKRVGDLKGMLNPRAFDVSAALKYGGENSIAVRLEATPDAGDNLTARGLTWDSPRDQLYSIAQCMYGWDWGPHGVPVGLWRPVRLRVCRSGPRRQSVHHVAFHHDRGSCLHGGDRHIQYFGQTAGRGLAAGSPNRRSGKDAGSYSDAFRLGPGELEASDI